MLVGRFAAPALQVVTPLCPSFYNLTTAQPCYTGTQSWADKFCRPSGPRAVNRPPSLCAQQSRTECNALPAILSKIARDPRNRLTAGIRVFEWMTLQLGAATRTLTARDSDPSAYSRFSHLSVADAAGNLAGNPGS